MSKIQGENLPQGRWTASWRAMISLILGRAY